MSKFETLKNILTNGKSKQKKCKHHYVIDAPNGKYSKGVCRLCKKTHFFKNSIDTPKWNGRRL